MGCGVRPGGPDESACDSPDKTEDVWLLRFCLLNRIVSFGVSVDELFPRGAATERGLPFRPGPVGIADMTRSGESAR